VTQTMDYNGPVDPKTEQLLADIAAAIEERHIKDHPLVSAIRTGEASRTALRGFVRQFYFVGPEPNPRPQCAMFAFAPRDPLIDELIFEDLIMEEGAGVQSGTTDHRIPFFRHCEELSLTRDEVVNGAPLPECRAFNNWRYFLPLKGDWLGGIAGISFVEGASAKRNDLIVDGLVEHYGFVRGSDGLQYWELHSSATEEGHGEAAPKLIRRFARDDRTRAGIREAAMASIDLQWLAFDGMYRAFFEEDPRYKRWW
jgi:pyrroloquinoline quinone (PQQ) biosynthesis protein C